MDEIEAIKAISDKLEKLSAEERSRVMAWAIAKYASEHVASPAVTPPSNQANVQPATPHKASKSSAKPKAGKKTKSVISMDKSLNLNPSGKPSATKFASEKAPANVKQKCVVAVYYLRDVTALEKVTVSAVYTFFKTLNWPLPADLKNALQQAGSAGWLDTADAENIKLTSTGENLVEHSLPPSKKS
jgi:hypothetical protein